MVHFPLFGIQGMLLNVERYEQALRHVGFDKAEEQAGWSSQQKQQFYLCRSLSDAVGFAKGPSCPDGLKKSRWTAAR